MKPKKQKITQDRLKERLSYDAETGLFKWRGALAGCRSNGIAGYKMPCGYMQIRIDNRLYMSHHLAWLYINGCFPSKDIDHINRNRSDNRIVNLREVNRSENLINSSKSNRNTSGVKGVSWNKKREKWEFQLKHKNKKLNGYHDSFADAVCNRLAIEQCLGWDRIYGGLTDAGLWVRNNIVGRKDNVT